MEIPALERDRIFDTFYRILNNDPWKHWGTGPGLTLVQKLTERLEAIIRVASSDNQTSLTLEFLVVSGVTFKLLLRRWNPHENEKPL